MSDIDRPMKKKVKRVYNRATGQFEEKKARPSMGMGGVVKDIANRITRGGLKTDARTKKHLKKAK